MKEEYKLEIIHPTYNTIAFMHSPDVPRKGDSIVYNDEEYIITKVTWMLPITKERHIKLTIEEPCI